MDFISAKDQYCSPNLSKKYTYTWTTFTQEQKLGRIKFKDRKAWDRSKVKVEKKYRKEQKFSKKVGN